MKDRFYCAIIGRRVWRKECMTLLSCKPRCEVPQAFGHGGDNGGEDKNKGGTTVEQEKIKEKHCRICGPEKGPQPVSAFGRHAKTKDGFSHTCLVCHGKRIAMGSKSYKETHKADAGTEPDKADRLASETMKIRGDFPDLPHTALYLDFGAYPDMYRSLEEAAREQFRTPEGQILKIISDFLLRQ